MNIQEALKRLKNPHECFACTPKYIELQKEYREAIKTIEDHIGQDWISVEKELPPFYEDVLVCGEGVGEKIQAVMCRSDWESYWTWNHRGVKGGFNISKITHWRTLPAPPQTAAEEEKG